MKIQADKPGRDTWRRLKGAAKIRYIWDYYKLPLFLIFICIYVAGYLIWRNVNVEHPQLYMAYVNLEAGEVLDHQLTEGFIDYLQPDEKNSVVKTLRNLALTENLQTVDGSYVYASQVKILAAIDSQQLDVVLMNREAYNLLSKSGFLADLSVLLSDNPTLLEQIQPYLTANEVVLSDNRIDYELNEADTREIISESAENGIDTSAFSLFKYAGFSDPVYFGIIANSPRTDRLLSFLSFLAAS